MDSMCRNLFEGNHECLVEIMSFLPSKDLINFVTVNKAVFRIFSSACTTNMQTQRMKYLNKEIAKIEGIKVDALSNLCGKYSHVVKDEEGFSNNMKTFLRNDPSMIAVVKAISDFPEFVLFGSSVLYSLLTTTFHSQTEYKDMYKMSDLDIFLVTEKDDREFIFRKLLKRLKSLIQYEYRVVRYFDVFNIIPKDTKKHRTVQIILRKYTTIDELLSFADLDCTRFAFDGETVWTTVEGCRAIAEKMNYLPKHFNWRYFDKRVKKYKARGFGCEWYIPHPILDTINARRSLIWEEVQNNFDALTNVSKPKKMVLNAEGEEVEVVNPQENEKVAFYENVTIDYEKAREILANCKDERKVASNTFKYTMPGSIRGRGRRGRGRRGDRGHRPLDPAQVEIDIYGSLKEFLNRDLANHFLSTLSSFRVMRKFLMRPCYSCWRYRQFVSQDAMLESVFCSKCKAVNDKKLKTERDLRGKVALVTGGRIKIGYEIALRLLRNGCTVIVTTRFVRNAKERYLKEDDCGEWAKRLWIYPLDLKNGNLVLRFVNLLKRQFLKIDFLINNAAITIRRPIEYYSELIEEELKPATQTSAKSGLGEWVRIVSRGKKKKKGKRNKRKRKKEKNALAILGIDSTSSRESFALRPISTSRVYQNMVSRTMHTVKSYMSKEDRDSVGNKQLFPAALRDEFSEPLDLRRENSWNKKIHQINPTEILEVQAVNNVSPTILISKLFSHMEPKAKSGSDSSPSYVINVTSDEGYFDEIRIKNQNHPHTNISKAALNQLTRSSAHFLAQHGIIMVSVDVGWSTSDRVVELSIQPPLSIKDCAARALDPILTKSTVYGKLYRNYRVVNW